MHIKAIKVDEAVELILKAAKLPGFNTTMPSQKILDDQTMAARVQAALVEEFPTARVSAQADELFVDIKANLIMGHMIPGGTGYEYHKKVNRYIDSQQAEDLEIDFISEPVGV